MEDMEVVIAGGGAPESGIKQGKNSDESGKMPEQQVFESEAEKNKVIKDGIDESGIIDDAINEDDEEGDDEEEDDDENADEAAVKMLETSLAQNPYDYSSHLALILKLQTMGELERLRTARENMSAKYPLSPDIWLSWLRDEIKLAMTLEQRNAVTKLCERAIKDYLCKNFVHYNSK